MTDLRAGDREYRAFVGPPKEYDLMGATQFALLHSLGLRAHHKLLDIGCGSLRAGRLFIAYLDPGHYFGLEPDDWLLREAIEKQIGHDLVAIKHPHFEHNADFDLGAFGAEFDFVLAQSIASHAGPQLTRHLLSQIARVLGPRGVAAVTFIDVSPSRRENRVEGWFYPSIVAYRRATVRGFLRESGLHGFPVRWFHPRQTWWLLSTEPEALPTRRLRRRLRGFALASEWAGSHDPLERPRRLAKRIAARLR